MRLGIVRGNVVLQPAVQSYGGRRLIVVEPVTMKNLRAGNDQGGGKALVAIDDLGAAVGQMIAFTEGREAANPFWPCAVPVDAYCAMIIDSIALRKADSDQVEVLS